jgi:hypothetical protein
MCSITPEIIIHIVQVSHVLHHREDRRKVKKGQSKEVLQVLFAIMKGERMERSRGEESFQLDWT